MIACGRASAWISMQDPARTASIPASAVRSWPPAARATGADPLTSWPGLAGQCKANSTDSWAGQSRVVCPRARAAAAAHPQGIQAGLGDLVLVQRQQRQPRLARAGLGQCARAAALQLVAARIQLLQEAQAHQRLRRHGGGGGAAAAASVRVCGYIVGVAACAPQARPPRDDKAGRDCGQGKHQIVPNASKTGQSPQRGAEEQCAGGSAHPAPPLWQPQHVSHAAGVDAPTARLCDHHRPFILQLILPQVEPLQAGLGRHARRHRRRPLRGDLIQRQLQLLRGRSAGATGGYTRQTTCRGLPRGRPC